MLNQYDANSPVLAPISVLFRGISQKTWSEAKSFRPLSCDRYSDVCVGEFLFVRRFI
jgi:hypothetical protein